MPAFACSLVIGFVKISNLSPLLLLALSQLATAEPSDLPAPTGKEKLTFQQIEERKDYLKEKIVAIEIEKVLGEGSEFGKGQLLYFVKDTSGSATPYGRISFPKEALVKMGVLEKPEKPPFTVYIRVHVFGGKAAAMGEAMGIKFTPKGENGGTYSW